MKDNHPNKSFKEAILDDWKNTWNDSAKKIEFIIDTSRISIFFGVTLSWLLYVFEPAMKLVEQYQHASNYDPMIGLYAVLGPILPLMIYYVVGDYWIGKGIVQVVKRLDL